MPWWPEKECLPDEWMLKSDGGDVPTPEETDEDVSH